MGPNVIGHGRADAATELPRFPGTSDPPESTKVISMFPFKTKKSVYFFVETRSAPAAPYSECLLL